MHRELKEEIDWSPSVPLEPWFSDEGRPGGSRVPRSPQRALEPAAVEGGPGDEVGFPERPGAVDRAAAGATACRSAPVDRDRTAAAGGS